MQIELKFFEIETSLKSKRSQVFSTLNQRRCRLEPVLDFEDECIEEKKEQDVSTQFSQTQKNQLIALQDHLERNCNVVQIFGFNSAKHDMNSLKG